MEQPPPLTPAELAVMQSTQHANLGQPQTVKVFGILHVILGVYGIGATALGIMTTFFENPFLLFMPKTPEFAKQMEIQAQMQEKMMVFNVVSLFLSLIITILILIAGVKLLRKSRSALSWSNRYAWVSLAGKVVTLILTFVYTLPVMRESIADPSLPPAALTVMRTTMVIGAVLGVVSTCTYPILSLILLNRPKTKEWFAAQPD